MPATTESQLLAAIRQLGEIGVALTAEQDADRLLEQILQGAMTLTSADAGTLYLLTRDKRLRFEVMHNKSLNLHRGGSSGKAVDLPDLPLYDDKGTPNLQMVAAYAAIKLQTENIADAYDAEGFDFSGTKFLQLAAA